MDGAAAFLAAEAKKMWHHYTVTQPAEQILSHTNLRGAMLKSKQSHADNTKVLDEPRSNLDEGAIEGMGLHVSAKGAGSGVPDVCAVEEEEEWEMVSLQDLDAIQDLGMGDTVRGLTASSESETTRAECLVRELKAQLETVAASLALGSYVAVTSCRSEGKGGEEGVPCDRGENGVAYLVEYEGKGVALVPEEDFDGYGKEGVVLREGCSGEGVVLSDSSSGHEEGVALRDAPGGAGADQEGMALSEGVVFRDGSSGCEEGVALGDAPGGADQEGMVLGDGSSGLEDGVAFGNAPGGGDQEPITSKETETEYEEVGMSDAESSKKTPDSPLPSVKEIIPLAPIQTCDASTNTHILQEERGTSPPPSPPANHAFSQTTLSCEDLFARAKEMKELELLKVELHVAQSNLNREKSQRQVAEELVKIVQTDVNSLTERNMTEAMKRVQVENELIDVKVSFTLI